MIARLAKFGIDCKTVGVGSTPTASQPVDSMKQLTEMHPGNYIFMGEILTLLDIWWVHRYVNTQLSTRTCCNAARKVMCVSDYQQYSLGSCELTDIAGRVATRVTGHYPHRNQFLIDAGFLATSHDGANKLPHGGSYGCFDNEPGLKYVNAQAIICLMDCVSVVCDFLKS